MTFTNDGNPKRLENGLINYAKLWTLAFIVDRILVNYKKKTKNKKQKNKKQNGKMWAENDWWVGNIFNFYR